MKPSIIMILTCPECATRYALDSALLEPGGRRVRCSECGAIWREEPEKSSPLETRPPPGGLEEIPQSVRPLPEAMVLPEPKKSTRIPAAAGLAAGILLCLALGGAAAWGMVAGRDWVVRLWPPSALMFELAGFDVSVPGEGFAFDQVETALAGTPESGATLSITGKIINMTGRTLALPPIVASLSGKEDPVPVEIWTESMPVSEIEAEQSFSFKITRAVQESDGDQLTLRFSDDVAPENADSSAKNNSPKSETKSEPSTRESPDPASQKQGHQEHH